LTYTLSSPLIAKSSATYGVARDWAEAHGAYRFDEVKAYLDCMSEFCASLGFDYGLMVAQSAHETANWKSYWWQTRLNPAGIGLTGDDTQNAASGTWETGCDAAKAHIAHMAAYVLGGLTAGSIPEAQQAINLDPRYKAVFEAGLAESVAAIGDLGNGKWATDPDYSSAIVERANQIFGGTAPVTKFTTTIPGLPGGPLETTYPVAMKIIPVGLQRPGTPAHTPRRSVQHGNGNPNAMAAADAQWLANGAPNDQGKPTQTSWHAIGDDTQVIVQVPLNEVTWQAADGSGPGNMNGVSCEMSEHSAIWSDQGRALRCIANCADFMGRCAARFGIDKPEQHWDFNWVECCNTPCDVQCGNRHNCPDKLRHSTIAGRPAWDIYVGDWNAAKADELARMSGTTPAPTPTPDPVPRVSWSETDVGPQTMHDGSPALAFLIELTAERDVPVRATATRTGKIIHTIKKGEKIKGRGSMRNNSGPYVFPDLGAAGVGRSAWSAFKPRVPKP
jgi:hypothetical protein